MQKIDTMYPKKSLNMEKINIMHFWYILPLQNISGR